MEPSFNPTIPSDTLNSKSFDHHQSNPLDICYELNKILDCGLDKETLSICIALLETGVNPEALAEVIKKLRKESAKIRKAREEARASIDQPPPPPSFTTPTSTPTTTLGD